MGGLGGAAKSDNPNKNPFGASTGSSSSSIFGGSGSQGGSIFGGTSSSPFGGSGGQTSQSAFGGSATGGEIYFVFLFSYKENIVTGY